MQVPFALVRTDAPTVRLASSIQGSIAGIVCDPTRAALPGVTVTVAGVGLSTPLTAITQAAGGFEFPSVPIGTYTVTFELNGFKKLIRSGVIISDRFHAQIDAVLELGQMTQEMTVTSATPVVETKKTATGGTFTKEIREGWTLQGGSIADRASNSAQGRNFDSFEPIYGARRPSTPDTSSYAHVDPNGFKLTTDDPVSTFGADVDTASYTNVRRFLNQGLLPPADAVRIEEFVNYFRFDYPIPEAGRPVSITPEVGTCPWAPGHRLVLIGARAQAVEPAGPRNLVFLIDVSGSMAPQPRLPLIKTALRMFVDTLLPDDTITIVTYAGTSGVVLPPTSARRRETIQDAIASLTAGGSTNGGAGLMLAYRLAREAFIPGGVNRIILATDGDFNVGVVGPLDLQHLIERERQSGVFLSVFGVGDDNFKDSTMEMLADKGNGQYSYLDSLEEARRVLIREAGSTLQTVAKDVKFQVEFNPATVRAWRLIGYEDRLMARQDFNDDRKDGGELGAGHTVTVLYEVVPSGRPLPPSLESADHPPVDPLIYQPDRPSAPASRRSEWLTVKVRYKLPDGTDSTAFSTAVGPAAAGRNLPFASAVAEFGLLLRNADPPAGRWDALVGRLRALASADPEGERLSFVHVVELAAGLQRIR
jgi:Ca-activated chloride channel family protein